MMASTIQADDEFNRSPFSKRLADTIANFDTTNGAPVIGIFGRWGYGKSTVLNYIKRELTTKHAEKVVLLEFNPWLFNSEEELITAFLVKLMGALKQSLGTRWTAFGKLLEKGSGVFGMIPVVGSGAQKLVESIGKEVGKDSLGNQRERAIEIMKQASRTVVVLIDDLDRLDPHEALTMLRLVRLNANFPKVVYVLAFDDAMLAKAAAARYAGSADSGRQFLEKIVQYPFTLPAVGLDRLVAFVLRHAKKACEDAQIDLSEVEWQRFQGLVDSSFSRRLTTPRQAIRYANALRFALPLLKGDVNPFDQIVVEGLRVLYPEIYGFLRDDVRLITSLAVNETERALNPDELRIHIRGLLQPADEVEIDDAARIVETLFTPSLRPKALRSVLYFNRYFAYALDPGESSESDILEALKAGRDADHISKLFRQLAAPDPDRVIQTVTALRPQLDPKSLLLLVKALAVIADVFISDPAKVLLESTRPTFDLRLLRFLNILVQLLLHAPASGNVRRDMISDIINAAPLEVAIVFQRHLRNLRSSVSSDSAYQADLWREIGLFEKPGKDAITDAHLKILPSLLDGRFLQLAHEHPERFFSGTGLLDHWLAVAKDDARRWLGEHLAEEPRDALRFLHLLKREKEGYALGPYPLKNILDERALAQTLQSYLDANAANAQISTPDRELAREYIDFHNRPAEGRGDPVAGS